MSALSPSVEDYLKVIYQLSSGGVTAATSAIAERLELTPAAVTGMVKKLAESGHVAHEPYRGVRLTASGRRAALAVLRRHRVIEAYLVGALGYRWDEVHAEAERLEHAASDDFVDRLARAIGEPRVDPHGAPIPTRAGDVDERRLRSLADAAAGDDIEVVNVPDEDAALLRYLADLGIRPGVRVQVVDRAPFEGPITLGVAGRTCAIGPAVAASVLVRPRSV